MKLYIDILKNHCQKNKYYQLYIKLCRRAQRRASSKIEARKILGYFESHHILPQCFKLGGEIDKQNLAYLTAREHFICHKCLNKCVITKEFKNKLAYSTWQITKRHKVNSRQYEYLKILLSETYRGVPKSDLHKQNLRKPKSNTSKMGRPKGCSNPLKGIKRPEVGPKISKAKRGKCSGEQNSFYGKTHSVETKELLSKLNTGRKHTEEAKQKISKAFKGVTPWNKGIPVVKETKLKASLSLKGRKNINNSIINKRVKVEDLQNYLSSGWNLGFIT